MKYSLGEAAKATGKQKSTILNALRNGRLSGKKNDSGQWEIDPAELHRVYEPVSSNSATKHITERHETANEIGVLQAKLEALQQHLSREQETVNDLREERARLLNVIEEQTGTVKQLTHHHEKKTSQRPPEGRIAKAWAALTGKM